MIRTFTVTPLWTTTVAFSPDGARLLIGDVTVKLWDAATGAVICWFRGHAEPANSVAFSPDGTRALTGSDDGTALLWAVPPRSAVSPSHWRVYAAE